MGADDAIGLVNSLWRVIFYVHLTLIKHYRSSNFRIINIRRVCYRCPFILCRLIRVVWTLKRWSHDRAWNISELILSQSRFYLIVMLLIQKLNLLVSVKKTILCLPRILLEVEWVSSWFPSPFWNCGVVVLLQLWLFSDRVLKNALSLELRRISWGLKLRSTFNRLPSAVVLMRMFYRGRCEGAEILFLIVLKFDRFK